MSKLSPEQIDAICDEAVKLVKLVKQSPGGRELWRAAYHGTMLAQEATAALSVSIPDERLIEALKEARRLCDQVKIDLSSAHAEICKLQGLDPATHSWPDWTPQANTLRWLNDKLIPQFDEALNA